MGQETCAVMEREAVAKGDLERARERDTAVTAVRRVVLRKCEAQCVWE